MIRMSSRRRRLLTICALAAAAAVVGIAALHTPWARARVLAAALARIAPDGSVRADRLEYRLPTLWFRLHGVQVRTPGQARPYFSADELIIDLPWTAAWRGLAMQHLEVSRPRLTVFVDANGTSNFTGEATPIDAPVPIERLRVSDLQIEWHDAAAGYAFDAGGIRIDLGSRLEPRLHMPTPARVRVADHQADVALAGGQLDWDERDLGVDGLGFESAGARLEIDGSVERLLAEPDLALGLRTQAPLEALASLLGFDIDGDVLTIAGRLQGPAAAPTVDLALDVAAAEWSKVALRRIRGLIHADSRRARLTELHAELGGGTVAGNLEVSLEATAVSRVAATWESIDAAALMGIVPDSGWVAPATRINGELQAQWPGSIPSLASVNATLLTDLERTSSGSSGLPIDGHVEVELAAGTWHASIDALVDAGVQIDVELTGMVDDLTLGGTAHLNINDLDSATRTLADVAPGLTRLVSGAGQATATLTVGGTMTAPTLSGHARVDRLRVADVGPMTIDVDLVAAGDSIGLRDLAAQFPGGSIDAALQLGADGRVSGQIRGTSADIDATVAALPIRDRIAAAGGISGSANWDLTVEGSLSRPEVGGTVSVHSVRIADSVAIDAEASLSPSIYGIRVDALTARAGDNQLRLGGVIGADGRTVDLLGELDLKAPADLGDRPGLDYLSSARAEIAIGADLESSTVVLDLWSLHAELPRFPVRSVTPGRVTWTPTEVSVEDLALRVGDLDLTVAGTLGNDDALPGIHAQLGGDLSQLSDLATVALAIVTGESDTQRVALSGNLDVDLRVGGTLSAPRPQGSIRVTEGGLDLGQTTTLQAVHLQASVDRGGLQVTRLGGRWQDADWEADGEVPLALLLGSTGRQTTERAGLRARLGPLRAAALEPWLGDELMSGLDGEATLSLQATTPKLELGAVTADVQLESLWVSSAGVRVSQQQPTRLRIHDGVLRIVGWTWTRPDEDDGSLVVAGTVELDDRRQLDLRIESRLDLGWLAPIVGTGALEGTAHGAVEITGTMAEPGLDGHIELADVGIMVADPQLVVGEVNGTLTITDTALHTDGLHGSFNGGEATLFLDLDLADLRSPTALAGLTARSIVFEAGGGRALGDADLTISAQPQGDVRIFGEVRLLAGGYRTDATLAADLLGASSVNRTRGSTVPTLVDDLSYDIRVTTVDDLRVDTPYAEFGLAADFQIVGTFARPGALGRMTVREGGIVRLAGNAYSVDRGVIAFDETNQIAPTLDIVARAEIGGEQISVLLTGSAFDPIVDASAESGLDSGDVLSLMATGRTVAAAGDAGREVLAEQAFDLLSGQYLAGVVRQLGFESVRFERGGAAAANSELFPRDTDLASRLTLTRSIENRFELVFSQNLTNADERSWIGTPPASPWPGAARRHLRRRHSIAGAPAPTHLGRRHAGRK